VLSPPVPLQPLLAAQPKLETPMSQVVHRVIPRWLLDQTATGSRVALQAIPAW
jgi:hypothetical protein